LLINSDGNEGVIEVFAEENFWDEHPIYHLEERFGEYLIVYFEPVLTASCSFPDEGEEKLYVKSSSGEVIDTLYAEETTGTLTQTEQLYASAEGKFVTADFNGAETIYNQIVNGEDSIQVKQKAYKRLYETGKLTYKPETYFNNLYTTFTSVSQSTGNALMKKIFGQLGSLSLIGQQAYIPAINEFDQIVQQSPNTEEAFYAEIDILTTSLLADTGNTQLGKLGKGRYLVKGSSDYMNKLNTLMKKHFGVEEEGKKENIIPTEYTLFQNYPNPFNPFTIIRYDIPKAGNVELKVYDILGREVMTLVNNEKKDIGRYEVQFNASNLATGVYIYRIQTNDYVSSKKMILMK
jgi:hypothetical protein